MSLALILLASCGGPGADDPGVFIAFETDFVGFSAWSSFDLGADGSDDIASDAPRTVYLNDAPPTSSAEFPIGTILVKTVGDGLDTTKPTFAMAKRGGGYNRTGAANWEWFELQPSIDGSVDGAPIIVWRGIAPPVGEHYAGVTGGTCNDCHAGAADNDFVPSEQLDLETF